MAVRDMRDLIVHQRLCWRPRIAAAIASDAEAMKYPYSTLVSILESVFLKAYRRVSAAVSICIAVHRSLETLSTCKASARK